MPHEQATENTATVKAVTAEYAQPEGESAREAGYRRTTQWPKGRRSREWVMNSANALAYLILIRGMGFHLIRAIKPGGQR